MSRKKYVKKDVKKSVNKNIKYTDKEIKEEDKNKILSYSGIEQRKNKISGPGRCLTMFLGIFPFVPLALIILSNWFIRISRKNYELILFAGGTILIVIMLYQIAMKLNDLLKVFIIDEEGNLYFLKISIFWYKIKDKMYLLNPTGAAGGRIFRIFYMISNIKLVLDRVTEEITFEDFIAMGKMNLYSEISDVKISKKKISFITQEISNKGKKKKTIRIHRVYEHDEEFCEYLRCFDEKGIEEAKKIRFNKKPDINEIILSGINKKAINKLQSFTVKWVCIMAWISAFMGSSDVKLLKNAAIIFLSVEFVYVVFVLSDLLINRLKKE